MIARICVIAAAGFACLYGLRQFYSGYRRKYFIVALCGMFALLLSRLYYLTLYLSSGDDEVFSVGVFGQVSAYLFFLTANLRFLSRKFLADLKKKPCAPAAAAAVLLFMAEIASAVRIGTVSGYLSAAMYGIGMGAALYAAVCVIVRRKSYDVCGYVAPFNLCVSVLLLLSAADMPILVFFGEKISDICALIFAAVSVPVFVGMLPCLKRGMSAWTE